MTRDFSRDHRWLSINTATLRKQADFSGIVEACARHGIGAVSPWREEVREMGLARAARLLRDTGLTLSGYCRAGMFPADAARRAEVREDNRQAVDEAMALGAPCLVIVTGGLPQFSRGGSQATKDIASARQQVEHGLAELLDYARQNGMRLALEPLHPLYAADRACVNTLEQALDICDRLDPAQSGALGLALDVYHVWWDPKLFAGIERAGPKRLLAFHICDWLTPTRDLLNDRGMMGDGVIEIPLIRAALEAQGYAGYAEVEIFSEHWWSRPIDEVLDTCIARYKAMV
jgi:sugar phosphate isomerase/epimerase